MGRSSHSSEHRTMMPLPSSGAEPLRRGVPVQGPSPVMSREGSSNGSSRLDSSMRFDGQLASPGGQPPSLPLPGPFLRQGLADIAQPGSARSASAQAQEAAAQALREEAMALSTQIHEASVLAFRGECAHLVAELRASTAQAIREETGRILPVAEWTQRLDQHANAVQRLVSSHAATPPTGVVDYGELGDHLRRALSEELGRLGVGNLARTIPSARESASETHTVVAPPSDDPVLPYHVPGFGTAQSVRPEMGCEAEHIQDSPPLVQKSSSPPAAARASPEDIAEELESVDDWPGGRQPKVGSEHNSSDMRHSNTVEDMKADLQHGESQAKRERLEEQETAELALFSLAPKNRFTYWMHRNVKWFLELQEPTRTGCLAEAVRSKNFELWCNVVIISNAVFAATTADFEIQNIGTPLPSWMAIFETVLLSWYIVELLMKFVVHRLYFFCNRDWSWNIFDLSLVCLSLYDLGLSFLFGFSGASVTFMRIFRLLKLTKVLRLLRALRFFRELRLMLGAIVRTMSSLFWALAFLTFVLYVFGLIILQGLTSHLMESEVKREEIEQNFGSMIQTMLSVYKATTGGQDWEESYELVSLGGSPYSVLFLFYIAFFTFAVMNILTGMIVENVVSMAARDEQTLVLEYRRQHNAALAEVRRLFAALDTHGSGALSPEALVTALESEEIHALMHSMEMDVQDAELFFKTLLAASGTGSVDIDSFVNGCMRMKGPATSIDQQCVLFEVKCIHRCLLRMHSQLARKLDFQSTANVEEISKIDQGTQLLEEVNPPNNENLGLASNQRTQLGFVDSPSTVNGDCANISDEQLFYRV